MHPRYCACTLIAILVDPFHGLDEPEPTPIYDALIGQHPHLIGPFA